MGNPVSKPTTQEATPVPEKKTPTHQWYRNTKLEWTEEGAKALLDEMKEMISPFKEKKLNILVFGPTGSGKSSLCNGFKTALDMKSNVSKYFAVGTRQDKTYTKNFVAAKWEGVTLYDMAGVFESRDIKSEDILNIILGKVAFSGKIDDFLHPQSLASQDKRNNISCVVLVLKPGMELGDNLRRIFEQIHDAAGEASLACHVVLTHLDEVDDCFKEPSNLNQVFISETVQKTVKAMADEVKIPPNTISIVRNYVHEGVADIQSTLLFLHTFKQILNTGCEQEEKRKTMAEDQ